MNLWKGTANTGDTLNLSDTIYNYNIVIFYNSTNSIRAILPITDNDLIAIRCGGLTVTDQDNIGTVGIYGTITNRGESIVLSKMAYVTHTTSSNHSAITPIHVVSIEGYR